MVFRLRGEYNLQLKVWDDLRKKRIFERCLKLLRFRTVHYALAVDCASDKWHDGALLGCTAMVSDPEVLAASGAP